MILCKICKLQYTHEAIYVYSDLILLNICMNKIICIKIFSLFSVIEPRLIKSLKTLDYLPTLQTLSGTTVGIARVSHLIKS